MSRLHLSTSSWCLLVVCLLHSVLLAAALLRSPEPTPTTEPIPLAATITLIPPAPPAVSPPTPEPEPVIEPRPVSKPIPKPITRPEPVPGKPDIFAAVPEELPAAPAPSEATTTTDSSPAAPSEPVFDADYLKNPAPVYPSLSRKKREEGVVLLRVFVSTGGTAEKLEVLQSSGFERLDQAALQAVKRWQFVPAKLGDELVEAWVRVPVRFNLNS